MHKINLEKWFGRERFATALLTQEKTLLHLRRVKNVKRQKDQGDPHPCLIQHNKLINLIILVYITTFHVG